VEAILDEVILVNESGCAFHSKTHGGPVRGPSFFDLQGSHLTKLPHLSRIDVRRCLDDANSNDSVYKEPIPADHEALRQSSS
jgi:hypothetical protein